MANDDEERQRETEENGEEVWPWEGSEEQEDFHEALEREDDLGAVIRAHVVIDNLVATMIQGELANPKAIRLETFEVKVKLAEALGLIDERQRGALLRFNKIRNRFGHTLAKDLDDDEVEQFLNTLPGIGRKPIDDQKFEKKGDKFRAACVLLRISLYFSMKGWPQTEGEAKEYGEFVGEVQETFQRAISQGEAPKSP